ncbi:MAG TPA: LysR family transcriptional regulator [Chthonomonadaceae bacterium]|nr:LysR family transcriptional regulator [Chthonomonadaceae bacterium]
MDRHELEAFEAVVKHGNFTRAAEALFLTQPAVTRQIGSLEAALRTRLFERLGRTVRVTPAGEVLHRYASEILRLFAEAESAVGDVATGAAGRLAVGASSTAATYVLPAYLRRFREAWPGVEMSVHTGPSAQVVEMVTGGEVDLGVVTGFREQAGLVALPVAEYATGVVVYPEHALAASGMRPIKAAELAGSPLILMEEGTNLRTYVDRLLSAAGVRERATLELDNVEAIKKMIEARLGISLLPLVTVETEVAAGRLVALPLADVPSAQRRITAIYRRDKFLSAAFRAFLDVLRP